MNNPWLMRFARRAHPTARLFCFPNAGVGASTYRLWPSALPEALDVCAVQPPGRENRLREPSISSIPDLVDRLATALGPELDLPFAFFGHSMGAVVAAELARALAERGAPKPAHLFVSARRPPHLRGTETAISHLPDGEFVDAVQRRYGGIPPELLGEPELLALLLPGLRADFAALETHRPPQRPPLACPISTFGGSDDTLTPREHLDAWRGETSGAFRVRVFSGGHFYLVAERTALLDDLAVTLAPLIDRSDA
jgi:surfactin synthase thioesterase subunit